MRVVILIAAAMSLRAQVCDPSRLIGAYAFQLTGTTTISGDLKPATSIGRLNFDGHGNISGISSAMFSGYRVGNPVSGTYELGNDCTLQWKLQSDSGAFQSFVGMMSADLSRAEFRQNDAVGMQQGILEKSTDRCSVQDLRALYSYAVSGSTTPMLPGNGPGAVGAQGTLDVARNATFQVASDCTVELDLILLGENNRLVSLHMRGILIGGGTGILAMETDPGATVSARFTAQ